MKVIHCDFCNDVMEPQSPKVEETSVIEGHAGQIGFGVLIQILGRGGEPGDRPQYNGDICTDCIWNLVDRIDPRPKSVITAP